MKRAFVIFTLCLVLVLGGVGAAGLSLHASRDQVAVTAQTLAGDPAAAEGFTARQTAHYKDHLLWDLTIPLEDPAGTATQVSYDLAPREEVPSAGRDLLHVNLFHQMGWGVDDQGELEHLLRGYPQLEPLRPVMEGLLDRSHDGGTVTETITLSDYYDCYPFTVHVDGFESGQRFYTQRYDEEALTAAFLDYFPIPVDPEETWEVVIWEAEQSFGREKSLSLRAGYPPLFEPYLLSAYTETDLYFTFFLNSAQGVSFEQVPGGFGLYHMDVTTSQDGEEQWLELDTIQTLCSLPQGAAVLDLAFDEDLRHLLLTYCLGEDYTCLVLDTSTGMVKQKLPVPAQPPAEATVHTWDDITGEEVSYPTTVWDVNRTIAGENFLVILGDETFHLYSLEGSAYRYQFTGPSQHHMILADYNCLTGAWNGETLALGSVIEKYQGWEEATGLTLSVFEEGKLVYQGEYKTSLDQISTEEARVQDLESDRLDWTDTIRLKEGRELALTYEG